ncbi:thermonuclease family protein [Psittacicella hinzii]|uniref:TNase-like domain-containing protein n=1 Tax=Psittacicella hinzii TaxID=2028575 RepID=A0A3A1YJ65_9GAMM|nr:thermonuclease family protein [Psittacicella hinzii]RIY37090.1 hypothetical protein CKF58_05355 [Psittacicella hinzii]
MQKLQSLIQLFLKRHPKKSLLGLVLVILGAIAQNYQHSAKLNSQTQTTATTQTSEQKSNTHYSQTQTKAATQDQDDEQDDFDPINMLANQGVVYTYASNRVSTSGVNNSLNLNSPCLSGATRIRYDRDLNFQLCLLDHLPLNEQNSYPLSLFKEYNVSQCKVTSVHDGDTVRCNIPGTNKFIRVRLLGIDAPETNQPYGKQAGDVLRHLVNNKMVYLYTTGADRYGRFLGAIYILQNNNTLFNVNQYLVSSGNVWSYKFYRKNHMSEFFDKLMYEAANKRLGLWAQDNPINPKDWRDGRR